MGCASGRRICVRMVCQLGRVSRRADGILTQSAGCFDSRRSSWNGHPSVGGIVPGVSVTASEGSYGQAVVPAVVPEGPGTLPKFAEKKPKSPMLTD